MNLSYNKVTKQQLENGAWQQMWDESITKVWRHIGKQLNIKEEYLTLFTEYIDGDEFEVTFMADYSFTKKDKQTWKDTIDKLGDTYKNEGVVFYSNAWYGYVALSTVIEHYKKYILFLYKDSPCKYILDKKRRVEGCSSLYESISDGLISYGWTQLEDGTWLCTETGETAEDAYKASEIISLNVDEWEFYE